MTLGYYNAMPLIAVLVDVRYSLTPSHNRRAESRQDHSYTLLSRRFLVYRKESKARVLLVSSEDTSHVDT